MNQSFEDQDCGKRGIIFFATGAYIGFFPIAPGTAGSILGILIYWAADLTPLTSSISILLLFPLGVYVSEKAERIFGQRDASQIVIDEIVGVLISVFLLPKKSVYIIGGLLLFRFFDIFKPYPIRRLEERVKGGLGVMLDDILAALYTNLILQTLNLIQGRFFL